VTRQYFVSTPVVSSVKGRVLTVDVEPNKLIHKGELLFTIDPVPFQNKVDALEAQLKTASADLKRARELLKRNIGKKRDVDVTQVAVDDLSAKLDDAKYDLERTEVRAESDGYVTQNFVFPALMAVPIPIKPAMVFVKEDSFSFIGWYRQNSAQPLKEGDEAEIAFNSIPGKVFASKATNTMPVMPEGEMQATGTLIALNFRSRLPGGIPVVMEITDPRFDEYRESMVGGAYGQRAIYSEHFSHVSIVRKIILRISSWMSYFFPFH